MFSYLSQGVGVSNAVEGDGGAGWADGGVAVNDDGGVHNGAVGVSLSGGCGSENGDGLGELHFDGWY